MTNTKNTKRALLSSVMALFLCFAMLLGTTYAWFTDSVTSSGNIIQTGELKVGFQWADGKEDPTAVTWTDVEGALFDYDNWEPGYAVAKHLKVSNEGTLALNYQMRIVADGVVTKLADAIDVYVVAGDDVKALTRADLDTLEPIGTLTEVLGTDKNLSKTIKGSIKAGEEADVYTLVLKMNENAGNEYQAMDLGCTFSVELLATQMSDESDSFGNTYDDVNRVPDESVPAALVRALDNLDITYRLGINGETANGTLDAGYKFEPTVSYEDAQDSLYRYWHADFVVYTDSSVPANSMALAGYYDAWCSAIGGDWIALTADFDIDANTEIRLVEALGATVNWEEICNYGNDGLGFQCGAIDLTGANAGTTLTVELRIYETTKAWDAESGTANDETGNYITVGSFKYTFPAKDDSTNVIIVNDAASLQAALDGAVANETTYINFANDIVGNVKATQLANANVVVNGCGYQYNGVMTVFGNGRQAGAESLTIKNVNFVAANGADACILSPDRSAQTPATYSYAHNVSVENCTFTDPDGAVNCAAIRHNDGGDKNWSVVNCTVDSTMHSLLQINNVAGKLTVAGCTVESKNGINLNSCTNVELVECEFNVKGYAVRFGVNTGSNPDATKNFVFDGCTLTSQCDDGDAVVIFRTSAANANTTLTLKNGTELVGTTHYAGNENINIVTE